MRLQTVLMFALALAGLAWSSIVRGEGPADPKHEEQAIRTTSKSYLEALARRDAKALAEFWTSDGDFVDELGRTFPAREMIAADAKLGPQQPQPERKLSVTSIRFITPNVAVEDGVMAPPESNEQQAEHVRGRFTVIWVKQSGKWLLASLRESRTQPHAAEARLEDLDWLCGTWSSDRNGATVEVVTRWNATRTYLLRELKIVQDGKDVFSGVQRIGWDPIAKRIRSWNFDTAGGYGEGHWAREGDSWVIQATGVLPDGSRTSSVNRLVPLGQDSFEWRTIDSETDGRVQANSSLTFDRKAAE